MAGSRSLRLRGGQFAVILCFLFTIVHSAGAQSRSPQFAQSGIPARSFAELVNAESAPETIVGPTTAPEPSYYADPGVAPPETCNEWGTFETISQSIFGHPDPNCWRPMCLSTLFSEGWDEPWVPSPSGSGGAPRQGWINAMDGNLYRLWFFTFGQGFNSPPAGDSYVASYTLLTPLSRRMMLITNIPFMLRNSGAAGLPIISPTQSSETAPGSESFGDISLTPRFLLHETQDFSLTAELAVVMPTGSQPLAGKTLLVPAFGFWHNFSGGWVIRGGVGAAIPTRDDGDENLISQLALGQTLTDHDFPLLGDFTYYVSAVVNTPLSDGETSVALTPGLRTHLGRDWYFLAGMPVPLTEQRVADVGMIFWFMKAW